MLLTMLIPFCFNLKGFYQQTKLQWPHSMLQLHFLLLFQFERYLPTDSHGRHPVCSNDISFCCFSLTGFYQHTQPWSPLCMLQWYFPLLFQFDRFLPTDTATVGTLYAPMIFPPVVSVWQVSTNRHSCNRYPVCSNYVSSCCFSLTGFYQQTQPQSLPCMLQCYFLLLFQFDRFLPTDTATVVILYVPLIHWYFLLLFQFDRFLPTNTAMVATLFAPITFPPVVSVWQVSTNRHSRSRSPVCSNDISSCCFSLTGFYQQIQPRSPPCMLQLHFLLLFQFDRFLPTDTAAIATLYAPITFPPVVSVWQVSTDRHSHSGHPVCSNHISSCCFSLTGFYHQTQPQSLPCMFQLHFLLFCQFERYLPTDTATVATLYAPMIFPPVVSVWQVSTNRHSRSRYPVCANYISSCCFSLKGFNQQAQSQSLPCMLQLHFLLLFQFERSLPTDTAAVTNLYAPITFLPVVSVLKVSTNRHSQSRYPVCFIYISSCCFSLTGFYQ